MPPKAMFYRKDRPGGLEFPSCLPCNNGARTADLVAGYIGRIFPDAVGPEEIEEVATFMGNVARRVPGLLQEMVAPRGSQKLLMRRLGLEECGALRLSGPLVTAYLQAFGARLGFAMHFERTGRAIPAGGGVAVMVYSNLDIIEGRVPEVVFEHLPAPATLNQGIKNVANQFVYGVAAAEGERMTMSYAAFRRSFAVLCFSTYDRSRTAERGVRMIAPGQLAVAPLPFVMTGWREKAPASVANRGW
jgi:hypothetical protein